MAIRIFTSAPDVLTEKIPTLKLKSIRLRDQALISTMPIAPVAGRVVGSNEAAGSSKTHVDAENPAPPQHLSSTCEPAISTGTENPAPPQHVSSAPEPAAPVTAEQLTGSMGEMLKVLIEDFRTGKKALIDLSVRPEDGCLRSNGHKPLPVMDSLPSRYWTALPSAAGWKRTVRLPKWVKPSLPAV